jgi:uncharacterized protein with PIN domain
MKLLADRMLGTLAKWLRLLGFDTTFPEECDDDELLATAIAEGRIILTRDRELATRTGSQELECLLLKSMELEKQLDEVLTALDLKIENPLTRCALCNEELDSIEKAIARKDLPEAILFKHDDLCHCNGCRKLYWEGSHWENMSCFIKQM